ncbi:MAG: histidine kinase, partial [Pirellulales bacterium]
GYVDDPQQVSRIIAIAQDKYPKVHNNISISGVQQVRLDVQVMEVSRTKLRTLGVDWAWTNGSDFVVSSVGGLINAAAASAGTATGVGGDTVRFGIVNGDNKFFGFIEALKRNDLAKVLAEPKLVTVSGRPAYFNSGGEIPILVPQSLGTVSIEYKRYGTQVDFVPIVLGNGRIRLEVRPRVSELDSSRGVTINNTTVPGFRVREVDTAVEMQAGQTLALAGLVQTRVEARHSGVPWLSDLPWVGAGFRRVTEEKNEIELLIIVTPELVAPLDKHEFPAARPGLDTCSPNDVDLYYRGHIEVPCCGTPGCLGGPNCQGVPSGQPGSAVYPNEDVPRGVLIQPDGQPMLTDPQANRGTPTMQPAQRMQASPAVASNVSSRAASTRPAPRTTAPRTAAPSGGEPGFIGPIGYDVER